MIKDSVKIKDHPCMVPTLATPSVLCPPWHMHSDGKGRGGLISISQIILSTQLFSAFLDGYEDPHALFSHMPFFQASLSLNF